METATYGSEFVASKTATEQIIDLGHTLRYLGIPIIKTKSYLFGDNRSVVTSSTLLHNRILSKVQKSFCSCTHVNSCQKYTLYINLHILLNI